MRLLRLIWQALKLNLYFKVVALETLVIKTWTFNLDLHTQMLGVIRFKSDCLHYNDLI